MLIRKLEVENWEIGELQEVIVKDGKSKRSGSYLQVCL